MEKSFLKSEIHFGGVHHTDIMLLTKHLSVSLKSGLTILEAIEMLEDQAVGKLKKILHSLLEIIESGKPLYIGLEQYPKYFNHVYVSMVRTGEMSGTLEENLEHLAEELKKAHALRQKVQAAMMYPTLVFIAVLMLGLSVSVFVLPQILPLFRTLDVELPLSTRCLIFLAEQFEDHGFKIVLGVFLGIVVLQAIFKSEFIKPITHRIWMKVPILKNIICNINLEKFSRTLSTLLSSGMSMDLALKITAEATENRIYRNAIHSFVAEIQKGNPVAQGMERHPDLFPKLVSRMVGMGEKTGSLEKTLHYLAQFYEDEVDNTMKNLSTVIEPILLILIGIVVAFVAISILGPIYKITGNLRG